MTGPANAAPAGTGLAPNVAAALAYLFGIISGVVFFVLEKNNPFVRFHAMQSILVSAVFIALSIALSIIGIFPIIGAVIAFLGHLVLGLVGLILWLVLMFKAFSGEEWEVPIIGAYARQYAQTGSTF